MKFTLEARGPRAARWGALIAVLVVLVVAWPPRAAHAAVPDCLQTTFPVEVPGVPDARIYGELCLPNGPAPSTVQVLVHGSTYNHFYWDWPQEPNRYSYVRKAREAGYATLNVDRLGVGASTHPPSTLVTVQASAGALHQLIGQLRSGAIAGHPFSRVVWVGHSLGSLYAWVHASMFAGAHDVDAYVLTGLVHPFKPSFQQQAFGFIVSAGSDPEFEDEPWAIGDPGYVTTVASQAGQPSPRGFLFYHAPTADPAVIQRDEELKDVVTLTEFAVAGNLTGTPPPPPETAPSRAITVPTLLVLGDHDGTACGPPDGIDCTEANVAALEAPYYAPAAHLEVQVTRNTGHDLQLHTTAPQTTGRILDWLEDQQG